jgi:hypothetical protein
VVGGAALVTGGVVVFGGAGVVVLGDGVGGGTVVAVVPVTTGVVVGGESLSVVRSVRGAFSATFAGEPQADNSTNGNVAPTTANCVMWRLTMLDRDQLGGQEQPNSASTARRTRPGL